MRFLRRYISLKYHSALTLSLAVIFCSFFLIRTPWLENHVESYLIEATGNVMLFWGDLRDRFTKLKEIYYPTQAQQELIDRLEKENAWLRHQAIELTSLRETKKSLEKLLKVIPHQKSRNFRTAPVLSNPRNGWNRMFLIGAGAIHGIKRGQPVISIDGIVGRIDSVSQHFSRVMPLTHQHFRIPVVGLKTHAQAILAGNGSKNPSLIYLEADSPIQRKEIFVSSIHGGGFPQGHFVGQLNYTTNNQPYFQTFISWSQLEYVHILLDFPILDSQHLDQTQETSQKTPENPETAKPETAKPGPENRDAKNLKAPTSLQTPPSTIPATSNTTSADTTSPSATQALPEIAAQVAP